MSTSRCGLDSKIYTGPFFSEAGRHAGACQVGDEGGAPGQKGK